MSIDQNPDLCPDCQHPQHTPGAECETQVHHGPNRWHLCLCLNRQHADRPCPPQMNCQGGTLGYSDVWYLQRGQSLQGVNGERITPDVLEQQPAVPSAAVPPTQAALRERIAEALYPTYGQEDRNRSLAIADAVLAVLPAPVDRAAVLEEAVTALRGRHCSPESVNFVHRLIDERLCTDCQGYGQTSTETPTGGVVRRCRACNGQGLRRLAEAPQPETQAETRCICGHSERQHFEDVCITEITGCDCGDFLPTDAAAEEITRLQQIVRQQSTNGIADLPARLEAVLTERFTELGNPFSEMRRHEQGPDGWPASHPVGPNKVAEVLRELLTAAPAVVAQPGKEG